MSAHFPSGRLVLWLPFPDGSGICLYASEEAVLFLKPRTLFDPRPARPVEAAAWYEAHDVGGPEGLRPLVGAALEMGLGEGESATWLMDGPPYPTPTEIVEGLRARTAERKSA